MRETRGARRAAAVVAVVGAMLAGMAGVGAANASAEPAPPVTKSTEPASTRPESNRSSTPDTITIHGHDKVFDVRNLPRSHSVQHRKLDRFVDEEPDIQRVDVAEGPGPVAVGGPAAPAPSTTANFEGIQFSGNCNGTECGGGHPPDTNGAVRPTYYIQTVNTAIGIFDKTTSARVAGLACHAFVIRG